MSKRVHVSARRRVAAPARRVYSILSDYHEGHPGILPRRAFENLTVEEGGTGAGTVIRFGMKSFGRVTWVRATVEEPEPGRVLVERIRNENDVVTTFTVDPMEDDGSDVTIETSWTPRGPAAVLERLLGPRLLRGIFREELENLDRLATDGPGTT